jgi:hypothetical protein
MSFKYVAAGGALAIAAIVGYVAWESNARREEHRAITALLAQASGGLAQVLKQPAPEHAARLDASLRSLHGLDAQRQKPYAQAADVYLVSVRAIAQRQADAARLGREAQAARAALDAHLRGPRGRDAGWIRQASELSKRAEKADAEYIRMQETLVQLLYTFPDAHEQVLPYSGPAALADPALHDAALKQAQADLKRAIQQAETLRRQR